MATLIGDGGHARDIAPFCFGWLRVAHHTECDDNDYIIGINNPHVRAKVASELHGKERSFIHPQAYLSDTVTWGTGTHIHYGAMMTRTTIGHHTTIGPGVHMAGDITIGDRVFIGIGAIVGNLVQIGNDAIIGAGSVVLKDVPAGEKVLGVWA